MDDRRRTPPPRSDSNWVAEVAKACLSDAGTFAVPADLPVPDDWSRLMRSVNRHRLEGLIAPHIAALSAPESIVEHSRRQHRSLAAHGLRLAHDTARVSRILADSQIDHLIVKGVPLSLVTGHDIAARGAGDVDLWVRPVDVAGAEDALVRNGWARRSDADRYPHPSDGFRWRHFLREMNEFPMEHPNANDVDVHWKLYRFDSEFSFDFDSALAAAHEVPIGSVSVPTLSPRHALEHLAQHARKEAWPNLRSIVDIVWLTDVIDEPDIAQLCRDNRNVRIGIALASRFVPDLAGLVDLDRSDQRLTRDAWERCLHAESWALMKNRSSGWEGLRRWLDQLWWMWRSAPSWGVRRSQLRLWIQRTRSFVDPRSRPWIRHSPDRTSQHT